MMCADGAVGDALALGEALTPGDVEAFGEALGLADGDGDGESDGAADGDADAFATADDFDFDFDPAFDLSLSSVTLKRSVHEKPWSCGHCNPLFDASLNANVVTPPGPGVTFIPTSGEPLGIALGFIIGFCCADCGLTGGAIPPGASVPPEPKLP